MRFHKTLPFVTVLIISNIGIVLYLNIFPNRDPKWLTELFQFYLKFSIPLPIPASWGPLEKPTRQHEGERPLPALLLLHYSVQVGCTWPGKLYLVKTPPPQAQSPVWEHPCSAFGGLPSLKLLLKKYIHSFQYFYSTPHLTVARGGIAEASVPILLAAPLQQIIY